VNGRLKPGVTLQQAQASLAVLSDAFHHEHPTADQKSGISVQQAVPYGRGQRGFEIGFVVFQPAIGLVLLVACANVAGLFLGKAATRRREIAVRLALGASRWRLIRQLVTEGIVVAQIAGALSLLVTWWTLRTLAKYLLDSFSNSSLNVGGTTLPIHLDPNFKVFAYTFVVGIVTGIGFALAPALHSTRLDLSSSLKDEGAAFGSGGKSRFRGWMVAVQIAVCLMLLIGAGMLVRSSMRVLSTNPGFDTKSVLNVTILNPLELGYSSSRTRDLNTQMQAKLRSLPGVTQVALVSRVPLAGNAMNTVVVPQGSAAALSPQLRAQAPQYSVTYISPEFFDALSIPILQGRTFTPQEIASRASVAVVSTGLAQRLWPGQSPLGKRIAVGSQAQQRFFTDFAVVSDSTEIIGVVSEIRSVNTIALDAGAIYFPRPATDWSGNLLVRTAGDPRVVGNALAAEVQSVDRNLSVSFQTLDAMMTAEGTFVAMRMVGIVFSIIGSLGLFLASVGIYSMVGYTVSRQTHEIGIRMALGAGNADVLRLILRRSMNPIGAGIAVGILLGVALSLVVSSIFPGLTLLDPVVIFGISALLTAIALFAAYIPARRAARVDPMVALRYE
jgi:predicted permease